MMKDFKEKLIETKTLANGVKISLFDFCRPVAGDRWYIKILCRLELPVPVAEMAGSGLDAAGQAAFRDHYKDLLVHEFARERHFVDEKAKEEAVDFLISQINDNSLGYIANPLFAEKLFLQKVEEFAKELDRRRQMEEAADEKEADEPADFSACFQD